MNFKILYSKNKIQIISIISLFICSIFSIGFFHPDEHFQILEFANYKLGNIDSDLLPWEFHEKIRPTTQPIIALIIIKLFKIFGVISPFLISFILRFISSLLCFYTMTLLHNYFKNEFEDYNTQKWFKNLSFLSWFLIFIGARFTSENWSACFIIIGLIHLLKNEAGFIKNFFLSGVFLGLAFLFRFQSAFLILGIFLWLIFIKKLSLKNILYLTISIFIFLILGIIIDSWFYGGITFSSVNYFYQNLILNKAANYGVEPWWFYFKESIEKGIPPLSIILILALIFFIYKNLKNPITWCIFPFILIHFFIGHKELRFLFPIFYFLPYILSKSIYDINLIFQLKKQVIIDKFMRIFILLNLILVLIICFRPMTTKTYLFQFLYSKHKTEKIIYYTDSNPYEQISFYKRNYLKLVKLDCDTFLRNSKKFKGKLIITIPEKKSLFNNNTLLFQTYPNWLKPLNFKNWMEKSEQYLIYKI